MTLKRFFAVQPDQRARYAWLAWFLVAAVIIAPRIFDLGVFHARDELTIWTWADEFTLAVWRGNPAGTLTGSDYPGIPLFWAQSLFLTVKYALPSLFPHTMIPVDQLLDSQGLDLLAERRLVSALLVSLQLLAAVWFVRRLFRWRVALLAAILLGLDPFSLSEARLLRLEMVSAGFVCLSILAYFLYLRERRRGLLLLSGILAGLGVSAKTSAGLLTPYIWLLLLLDFFFGSILSGEARHRGSWWGRFKQMIGNGLIWAGGAVGAFWLVWPAMWVRPVAAVTDLFQKGIAQAAASSVWHGEVFFWGQTFFEDPGPFFYPVALAFRTTPLTWVGTMAAIVLLGASWRRGGLRWKNGEPARWGLAWPETGVALLLLYVLLMGLELSLVLSKVDRFMLIFFPALNILSAIGLAALIRWLVARTTALAPLRVWLPGGLIGGVLAIQLVTIWPTHPYYFTYWNPLVGGGPAAMTTLPIGAGEGVDEAMAYLNSLPGAAGATLVCGASRPWCSGLFKGRTERYADYFDGRWVQADYASFYISHLQRHIFPPEVVEFFRRQPPLHRVELQGVTYMWLYAVPEITHFGGPLNDLAGLGRLLGYNLDPPVRPEDAASRLEPGQALKATVWWTNLGAGVNNLVLRLIDRTGYEWARRSVIPQPDYATISDGQRAVVVGQTELTIPPGTPPGLYFLRLGIAAPGESRLLGEFDMPGEADKVTVTAGEIFAGPDLPALSIPVDRPLAPNIKLLGYTLPDQLLTADRPVWLSLYWQATAKPADYLVRLRLLDDAGEEAAIWQGQPGYGAYPTGAWREGEIVHDVWALQAPPDTPIGRYELALALVKAGTPDLQSSADGPPDSISLGQVEVWPDPVSYDLPRMQAEVGATFGGRLALLGYDLYFDLDKGGRGKLSPTFYWQSPGDMEATFDLRLTLRAATSGRVVDEWRLPLGAGGAKGLWKAGEVVNTIYELEVDDVGGEAYHLDISLLDHESGRPEPVTAGNGKGDFVRIENIQDKIVVRTGGEN